MEMSLLSSVSSWSPSSWTEFPALHQPQYADPVLLERVLEQLAALPPLVTSWEVSALKAQLGEAALGKRFLLMGGDCAESFDKCTAPSITNKVKILLQMSLILVQGAKKPVIRVGRFAGQYAKPRSDQFERHDGLELETYKGDLINSSAPNPEARQPDPWRLLRGYERSALTLNFIRSLGKGGFADLHHPEYWDLDFVEHSEMAEQFHAVTNSITESLRFMESVLGVHPHEMAEVDFYTSHEALHLHYEQAQTRRVPRQDGWYNLSTHLPWIGMRTAQPDGAHVEYFRGIVNPVAVKIGPAMTDDTLLRLIDALHPEGVPGRLTLIHRMGTNQVGTHLPRLIRAAKSTGKPIVFCCDPMHGNTKKSSNGIKTRYVTDILSELEQAVDVHRAEGSHLGGVHFELTGENVTECVGGARGLTEEDLTRAYQSEVDPRLNYEQALELTFRLAAKLS
jgi:3-deoxy-7-phosphoheptulonate synthase